METSSPEKVVLPTEFDDVSIEHLAELISDMLERLIVHNDKIPLSPESLTRFHSRSVPNISILDYLKRIVRFTNVEKACLLLVLYYIDQICARKPLFTLSSLTCHRFIIAAITVSSKGFCDTFCTNQVYAKVGGISVMELNTLEREFLSDIDWRLVCSREVLHEYYINLVRTNSAGRFVLANDEGSPASSESDIDIDIDSGPSRDPSPEVSTNSPTLRRPSVSMAVVTPTSSTNALPDAPTSHADTVSSYISDSNYRATLEQNMAFAALLQQHIPMDQASTTLVDNISDIDEDINDSTSQT